MGAGFRQKCRLFLEGKEVPFISATIICEPGTPKIAMVNLVPVDVIKFIKPRTQIHIFVQDFHAFGDSNFYLGFEGEVSGRVMSKSQNSRFFQIIALSYLSYTDDAKVHFMNPQFQVAKLEETVTGAPSITATVRANSALSLTGTATAFSVMVSIILNKNNKDIVEGVADVLKKVSSTNLFYKMAYDRLRIADRVKAYTSQNLAAFMKELKIEEFLTNYTGATGGLNSLLELLRNIMGTVFHEIIDVPFPGKVNFKDSNPKLGRTIGEFLFVPDNYSLPPPKCNVIFPSEQINFEFREDFRQSPTRFMFRGQMAEAITAETGQQTYQAMYYPDSFSDYMFSNKRNRENTDQGLLGPATLLVDKTGKTYANLFYGQSGQVAVGGTSISNRMREQDFLTNDEAIRGIFLENEVFPSSTTALARGTPTVSRQKFFKEIGKFMYFKSRFQSRNVSASLKFSPFLVPGFNCMFLDDSDAGQTFTGKLQAVTHTLTNDGCATSVAVGYARNFDEVDAITGDAGDPPTPEFFDPKIFGSSGTDADRKLYGEETAYLGPLSGIGVITDQEVKDRMKVKTATVFPNISKFFQSVLGVDSVTDRNSDAVNVVDPNNQIKVKSALVTTRGAATYLAATYQRLASSESARDAFVAKYTRRPLLTMPEAMSFLGAESAGGGSTIPDEFAEFVSVTTGSRANRFDAKGYEDERQVQYRRQVIDTYVTTLKNTRGFRG